MNIRFIISRLTLILFLFVLLNSCKKEDNNFPDDSVPVLTTLSAFAFNPPDASCGGLITSEGGSEILSNGICWSTNPDPTIADSISLNGTISDSFTCDLKGLNINTTYYVKAFATNKKGTGYGNQIKFNSGFVIGINYQGGLVFYNDGNGHGLVCATSDQSKGAEWGCAGTTISGADGNGLGTGKQNTLDILAGCSTTGIAARLCSDLVSGGYDDWYLPSQTELGLICSNLFTAGLGDFTNAIYWSSSEIDSTRANGLPFYCGYLLNNNKGTKYFVRAIRDF